MSNSSSNRKATTIPAAAAITSEARVTPSITAISEAATAITATQEEAALAITTTTASAAAATTITTTVRPQRKLKLSSVGEQQKSLLFL